MTDEQTHKRVRRKIPLDELLEAWEHSEYRTHPPADTAVFDRLTALDWGDAALDERSHQSQPPL